MVTARATKRPCPLFAPTLLSWMFLILSGCGGMKGEGAIPQKLYIDATRSFAVEFPGNWRRFLDPDYPVLPDADAVGWEAPESVDEGSVARMLVVIPHTPADNQRVQQKIAENLPGFVVTSSDEVEVFDLPSVEILGYTPQRNYDIFLIDAQNVQYVLVYSALPEEFDRHRSQFEDLVESFEILP